MRQLLLILALILLTLSSFGQGFSERHPDIQSFVHKINSELTSYKKVAVENEELMEQLTDGGGELIGYFSDKEIQKMELRVGLSYGTNTLEFFYKNSQLYYVIEIFKQFQYDEDTGSFNYTKTNQTFRGQYLFVDPFDYETLGHNRFENDELDPEEVLKEEAKEYLMVLQNKNTR